MKWLLAADLVLFATPALADPCKAIPDEGRAPGYLHKGGGFSGPVVYIVYGDGLCVDVGKPPSGRREEWVEVRVADFYPPELHEAGGPAATAALARITRGHPVSCVADHQTYDRIPEGRGAGLARGAWPLVQLPCWGAQWGKT
jgi:micrococcal nuclease